MKTFSPRKEKLAALHKYLKVNQTHRRKALTISLYSLSVVVFLVFFPPFSCRVLLFPSHTRKFPSPFFFLLFRFAFIYFSPFRAEGDVLSVRSKPFDVCFLIFPFARFESIFFFFHFSYIFWLLLGAGCFFFSLFRTIILIDACGSQHLRGPCAPHTE